ncbi:hypothetical protein GE09DRAFT_611020 [Coniochaeta sp. 2T2.1]|nr:hypothetical protein GE09DRAFT_611020 [Coniochaeta sp. 2T2.1]
MQGGRQATWFPAGALCLARASESGAVVLASDVGSQAGCPGWLPSYWASTITLSSMTGTARGSYLHLRFVAAISPNRNSEQVTVRAAPYNTERQSGWMQETCNGITRWPSPANRPLGGGQLEWIIICMLHVVMHEGQSSRGLDDQPVGMLITSYCGSKCVPRANAGK